MYRFASLVSLFAMHHLRGFCFWIELTTFRIVNSASIFVDKNIQFQIFSLDFITGGFESFYVSGEISSSARQNGCTVALRTHAPTWP